LTSDSGKVHAFTVQSSTVLGTTCETCGGWPSPCSAARRSAGSRGRCADPRSPGVWILCGGQAASGRSRVIRTVPGDGVVLGLNLEAEGDRSMVRLEVVAGPRNHADQRRCSFAPRAVTRVARWALGSTNPLQGVRARGPMCQPERIDWGDQVGLSGPSASVPSGQNGRARIGAQSPGRTEGAGTEHGLRVEYRRRGLYCKRPSGKDNAYYTVAAVENGISSRHGLFCFVIE